MKSVSELFCCSFPENARQHGCLGSHNCYPCHTDTTITSGPENKKKTDLSHKDNDFDTDATIVLGQKVRKNPLKIVDDFHIC